MCYRVGYDRAREWSSPRTTQLKESDCPTCRHLTRVECTAMGLVSRRVRHPKDDTEETHTYIIGSPLSDENPRHVQGVM